MFKRVSTLLFAALVAFGSIGLAGCSDSVIGFEDEPAMAEDGRSAGKVLERINSVPPGGFMGGTNGYGESSDSEAPAEEEGTGSEPSTLGPFPWSYGGF